MMFSPPVMVANDEAEMMLYGAIETNMPDAFKWDDQEKSSADFDKEIKAALKNGARKLLLRINSPGGYVGEAIAMRNTLINAGFEKLVMRIEGWCASAATLIASIPTAHVQMCDGAEYMIHNPYCFAVGNADELEQKAAHLRMEAEQSNKFYREKTGQSEADIKAWMDKETWFSAEEAVKLGFADELIKAEKEGGKMAAEFAPVMCAIYRNVPETIKEQASAPQAATDEACHNNNTEERNETGMEIKDVTLEMLRDGNPEVFEAVCRLGAEGERERISDINELTGIGGEEMRDKAIADGTSALDYHKMIVKAQKEKAKEFIEQRKEEVKPAENVGAGAVEEPEFDAEKYAKEIAGYAAKAEDNGGMF